MPPLRTRDSGPRNRLASLIATKDSRGSGHEGDVDSRLSPSSPISTAELPADEPVPKIIPEARKANAFFDNLPDSEIHRGFMPRYMKTNICDQCNKRNKSVMQRCTRCNMHFCKPCTETVNDGKHLFNPAALDWFRPDVMIYDRTPKQPKQKRQTKKIMTRPVAGSRNRVEKYKKPKVVPLASITRTRRVVFVDRPLEGHSESQNPAQNQTPKAQENSIFIREESGYEADIDNSNHSLPNTNTALTAPRYPFRSASITTTEYNHPKEQHREAPPLHRNKLVIRTPLPSYPYPHNHPTAWPIRNSMYENIARARERLNASEDVLQAARSLMTIAGRR